MTSEILSEALSMATCVSSNALVKVSICFFICANSTHTCFDFFSICNVLNPIWRLVTKAENVVGPEIMTL